MHKWILGILLFFKSLDACTAFQLSSQDGTHIYCRSLEFGFKLSSDLLIVPRQTPFTGTAPQGKSGLKWACKYGYIGMNQAFARTLISDGMNEKGVAIGILYFPGYAQYENPDPARQDQTLGAWELASYLLATCANLSEVKTALSQTLVAQEILPGTKDFIFPLHFYITDSSGEALVVEYVDGKRKEYSNPLRVLTNSPTFDWHLTNLSTYIHLSPMNYPNLKLPGYTIENFGQGSGLLGLPGDYTPPSRFVRATFFSQWAIPQKTANETLLLGFHILNNFDIIPGLVKSNHTSEMTEWTLIHDMTSLKTYFRSYASLQIQMVDLKKIDFKTPGFRRVQLKKEFTYDDETKNIEPLPNPSVSEPIPMKTSESNKK
jgi:choloylglycine hydrolase